MKFYLLTLFATCLLLSSCSIKQTIEPSELNYTEILCIVEDHDVRASFLNALTKIIDEKKIRYRVVGANSAKNCEWSATYNARWSWDLALYMSYAKINIYKNGILEGQALYDATQGQGNMNKFIDAESKIRELVDKLIQN